MVQHHAPPAPPAAAAPAVLGDYVVGQDEYSPPLTSSPPRSRPRPRSQPEVGLDSQPDVHQPATSTSGYQRCINLQAAGPGATAACPFAVNNKLSSRKYPNWMVFIPMNLWEQVRPYLTLHPSCPLSHLCDPVNARCLLVFLTHTHTHSPA